MQTRKYRWSKDYESAEEELVAMLRTKHIATDRWHVSENEVIPAITSATDIRIWCAEGSGIYTINEKRISIQPGDALEIPSGISYSAIAGMTGYAWYQSPPSVEDLDTISI